MRNELQHETLVDIENQLGAQDHKLAHALDTMTPPTTTSLPRRTLEWIFFVIALIAPVLTITAVALMPFTFITLLFGATLAAATIKVVRDKRSAARPANTSSKSLKALAGAE